MATYFVSDQHICLLYPERGQRFARFLALLDPKNDRLVIAGDLCDFWFTTREARTPAARSEAGLVALKSFLDAGGELTLLAGNHDQHLEWFYLEQLGKGFVQEPVRTVLEGRHVNFAHGHLLGGRSRWKGWMESRSFLKAFEQVPDAIANNLSSRLKKYNSRNKKEDNLRHFLVYQDYVQGLAEPHTELVVLGHVHQTILREIGTPESTARAEDVPASRKLAVLGHWFYQSSWLKLESGQADFYIWQDDASKPELIQDHRILGPAEVNR